MSTKVAVWIGLGLAVGCTVGSGEGGPNLEGDAGETTGTEGGEASTESTGSSGEEGEDEPKFDVGAMPDLEEVPLIPETCEQAEEVETSVGCSFFTTDLDNNSDEPQFAVVVSNVQTEQVANVRVERRTGGDWEVLEGPLAVEPLGLHEFHLDDFHLEGTGINPGGAYRVVSDVPIVAYQFNPIDGENSLLSDASMLYPVASWDETHAVVNWGSSSPGRPFITIAAAFDGTEVEITPSVDTSSGLGVAAGHANEPMVVKLDAGDALSINPKNDLLALTGTRVASDPDHPVAVFSGHTCAFIPGGDCCCDHLEEQVAGLHQWGKSFVAAHLPVRDMADPEVTVWQIHASEDDTEIWFEHDPALTGMPGGAITLDAGEVETLQVTAPVGVEADFRVEADRPMAIVGYMVGASTLSEGLTNLGDPSMIQFPPVEQFLPRYVVLVPGTWINDAFVITRPAGATITVDGVAVPEPSFAPVGDGDWEVARIEVEDGVHVLDGGETPFGVVVVGWDDYDSYAYVGGTGAGRINPNPAG